MNQEGPLSSSRFFIAVFCCLCHYAFHLCFLSCFSVSKMCPTLWPYALRHARLPCHSLSSRICPSSCQWCHPTISPFPSPEDLPNPGIETASPVSPALLASSLHTAIGEARLILCRPLFLLPSIFPRIRIFPVRQLFTSRGWSIGASGLALVCPMNIQGWFPLGLTSLISLLSKGLSRVFSSTTIWKHQFFGAQSSMMHLSYPYMTTGKMIALIIRSIFDKVMSAF